MKLDSQLEIVRITKFLKSTVHERGFSKVVIACSGGVDSTTVLYLAVKALGKDQVHALLLPYGDLHPTSKTDALLALQKVGIPEQNIHVVDIATIVDAVKSKLGINQSDKIRLGNLMARTRMLIIYDFAKKNKALVLGTENKSEYYLGYFTRFGDEASDIEPIRHLYKTQVWQLAKALGVPDAIITKAPTAGLWPGQTDEGEFGFIYQDADQILEALYDEKLSDKQIIARDFSSELVAKVKKRVQDNWFKHELPITSHYFSHTNGPITKISMPERINVE